ETRKKLAEQQRAMDVREAQLRREKDEVAAAAQATRVQALAAQDRDHAAALRKAGDEIAGQKAAVDGLRTALAAAERRSEDERRSHADAIAAREQALAAAEKQAT